MNIILYPYRPLPHHGLVEDYIKAYYMSETDLEVWLRENKVIIIIMTNLNTLIMTNLNTLITLSF